MIKFWKSAAKGKSGCPVRPPEAEKQTIPKFKLISVDLSSEHGDSNIFEKKSQLSLTLKEILNEKICIKHFVSYMESIEKILLINCWLELDNYRLQLLVKTPNVYNGNCHNKINHSKSFDDNTINSSCDPGYSLMAQRNSWKASCNSLNISSKIQLNNDFVKNEPMSLTDQAISLFKKYVALEAPNKLKLTDEIRKNVISNICHPEGKIREDCFKPVQESLMCEMETYFSDFQNSPQYIKMQIDILTSGNISLKDILYNETILFYFTEYLEQESCSVLLEFLIAVSHFKDNLNNCKNVSIDQIQSDAIILYDKYFSLQATSPIGFSTEIRLKVESDICCETGPVTTCFDIPYRIVFETLSNYVRIFLESEIYYNYLSEMIKSVDQMYPNCKSHSDCSSEYSLSTQNTLLAMGDLYIKKKRNHSVPDMTIDSNQLYNADALWQRKKHDGLTLGRINSLGRFESKFEPDPDKMHKSVLRKMVSKFVPATSSNVKEEMAWQIAHMIVKDVTDLTMAPPENDHE